MVHAHMPCARYLDFGKGATLSLIEPIRARSRTSAFKLFPTSCEAGTKRIGSRLTQMYGPAVRSKKILKSWRSAVLHQCIRPYVGASCSGPSWISARLRSH